MAIHGELDSLYSFAREQFAYFEPARQNPAFMENAGGSQVPNIVIDAIADYMRSSYAQLGAGYAVSDAATATVARAHAEMKTFMNASSVGETVLGGSTSQLMDNLGGCYSRILGPGDEVIVHEACHEANAGPWYKLAERCGATIKVWRVDPITFESRVADLAALVTSATKLVAVVHVSNILGEVMDLAEVVRSVKAISPKARVIADGVAYAPHLPIDVQKWGVDWYVFSSYKCWGPHAAVMFGSHSAFAALGEQGKGPNHFWIPASEPVYKMEIGGPNHEACAGIVALSGYLRGLAAAASPLLPRGQTQQSAEQGKSDKSEPSGAALSADGEVGVAKGAYTGVGTWSGANADGNAALRLPPLTRNEVETAYGAMQEMEQPLMEALVGYLAVRPDVTLVGPRTAQKGQRVPVVSFMVAGRSSADIAATLQKEGFALRNGHMYAYRLLTGMKVPDIDDGVVRISLQHYNTPQEVRSLLLALDSVLAH